MNRDRQPLTPLSTVALLARRWPVVLTGLLLGIAAAVGFILFAPKWYRAQVTVVPASSPKGSMPIMSAASDLSRMSLDLFGMGATESDRTAAVFKSRSVTDAVIERLGLMRRYEQKYIEKARKQLWGLCSVSVNRKAKLATLSCEDKDPAVARDLVNAFADIGNQVFRRVSVSSASEERRFLEERVAQARADVAKTAGALRDFEEQQRVVDLDEQSRAVISALASLQAELITKQLELSYLSTYSSRDEASAVQLRQQIGVIQARLRILEEGSQASRGKQPAAAKPDGAAPQPGGSAPQAGRSAATQAGGAAPQTGAAAAQAGTPAKPAPSLRAEDAAVFPPAQMVPSLRYQYEQLYRERKVQEIVYLLLTQRYELAKADEARDTSAFQILDPPTLPTYPARPVKWQVLAIGLAAGLLLGVALVLVPVGWRRLRADLEAEALAAAAAQQPRRESRTDTASMPGEATGPNPAPTKRQAS